MADEKLLPAQLRGPRELGVSEEVQHFHIMTLVLWLSWDPEVLYAKFPDTVVQRKLHSFIL